MERDLKKGKKEVYEKPKIKTETVEMGVYGQYQPVPQLQPFFGLCPPCPP